MKGFLGLLLLADGIATTIGGRDLLHYLRTILPSRLYSIIDTLLAWPEPLLRWASLLQTLLGILLIAGPEDRTPPPIINVEVTAVEPEPTCAPAPESAG
ncbi:MAG: hypothetical protein GX552_19155 [Chloroflexi bacterium]|jgi:hypothetical protein|nr:hypothetical protein [Chloroflexota bacterium]